MRLSAASFGKRPGVVGVVPSRVSPPSFASRKRDTVLEPVFVMNEYLPFLVTTTQQVAMPSAASLPIDASVPERVNLYDEPDPSNVNRGPALEMIRRPRWS